MGTIRKYDGSFKLIEQAVRQKPPCDWGIDLTYGAHTTKPGLANARMLSQIARLRTRWHLEQNNPDKARDELLAVFVLGRRVASDGMLLSCLVQFAVESSVVNAIAENWFRLSPELVEQYLEGIDSAPAKGMMLTSIQTERYTFRDWLLRQAELIQTAAKDEKEAQGKIREMLRGIFSMATGPNPSGDELSPALAERIFQAAGETTAGFVALVKGLDPYYDKAIALMKLPYADFSRSYDALVKAVKKGGNPLAKVVFDAFQRPRMREFAAEARLAQLRAASAYRRLGLEGLKKISDPLTGHPFNFRKISVAGVERGFELASKADVGEVPVATIFIETDGPAFFLSGKKAGQLVK